MKECACRLRGGSNGWGTASSTYDAMAYSQSVSQASTWFFGKYMLPPVNVSKLFKHFVRCTAALTLSSPRRRTLGRRSVAAPAGEHAQHALWRLLVLH